MISEDVNRIAAQQQDAVTEKRIALRVWCITNNIQMSHLARLVGLTIQGFSMAVARGRMSPEHHAILLDFGVPEELLPEALKLPTGPKPQANPN